MTESPRQLESSLLLKSAKQLQDVHDNWSGDIEQLKNVLFYNRRLWTVFVGSVCADDNELPLQLRNNIANLGAFIFKHSIETQYDPRPERLLPLISINREIAAGLAAGA
ncbi:MAG: flagellar biosynthesis regulator FlaF [Hyphomicrobiales bacterium]